MIKEGIEYILGIKLRRKFENNFIFGNSRDSASHKLDFFFPFEFLIEGTAIVAREPLE